MRYYKLLILLALTVQVSFAGNEQRIGQAGGSQVLVNSWGMSSGLAGSNVASTMGIEAMYQNIAGAVFANKTELGFTHTRYLTGSETGINTFGLVQKIGETNALVIGFKSFSFGDIERTTVVDPEGGLGTFRINTTVITAGFSKAFSNSIYGGVNLNIISQGVSDLSATGVTIDAGIIYKSGIGRNKLGRKNRDNFRFGITLKNVGPTMQFSGDGFSFKGQSPEEVPMTLEHRSQDYEMPTQLSMGVSYDFKMGTKVDTVANTILADHILTVNAAFVSNSFTRDQYKLGLEYSYKHLFQLRGGYMYEEDIYDEAESFIVYSGPSCGATVKIPLNKETGSYIGIDYAYRATYRFDGIHTIGARVIL